MTPKVSIIIPLYNSENKISGCLKSAMNQTESDIEIIVVNDGSTDKSGDVCDELSADDDRITVIHQSNKGAGSARNKGLELAKGEYLYFLDSDDKMEPNLVEENLHVLSQYNTDVLIFGYTKVEKGRKNTLEVNTRLKERQLHSKQEIKEHLCRILEDGATFAVWNKMFKRDLIVANNIKYPDMKRNQDMAFTLEALKHANSISVNPKKYYYYSFNSEAFKYDQDLIKHHLIIYRKFYQLYENWMEYSHNRAYAVRLFTLYFFHSVPFFIVTQDNQPLQKLRKLVTHSDFEEFVEKINFRDADNSTVKGALLILKFKNSLLLFSTTKFKLLLTNIFGKHFFRKLVNK